MKKKVGIVCAILVLAAAGFGFGSWMYKTAAVDKMREAAIHEVNSMVDIDAYGPVQQKKVRKILEESDAQIMEAEDERTVSNIKRDAREELGKIKTLEQLRKGWYKSLKKEVDLDAYRQKQQKEIRAILKDSKKKIYQCERKKETTKIKKDALDRIGKLKTNAELTAEEEAKRQAELARQRAAAEAAAAAAAAEKAKAKDKKKSSNKKKNSEDD